MSTGTGLPSRLELGTEAYKRRREEELRQERLRQQEELQSRPGYGARGVNPNLLTVTATNRLGNANNPHFGMPSTASPFSPALLAERRQANQQRGQGPFSPELLADLRGRGVGARHHAGMGVPKPKEEEDEYGFLDAMFLANLVAGMQGGPPPTPYGTAVGGGNKTWASLPSLMRMS
jgi:hypothetical protein